MADKIKKKPAVTDAVLKHTKKKRVSASPKSVASPPASAAAPASVTSALQKDVDTTKSAAASS
eukprot:9759319-Heterocapsa_arctica.AAC.1